MRNVYDSHFFREYCVQILFYVTRFGLINLNSAAHVRHEQIWPNGENETHHRVTNAMVTRQLSLYSHTM